jgi:hypothetical protein
VISWSLQIIAALFIFVCSTVFDVINQSLTTVPNLNSFDADDLLSAAWHRRSAAR